MFSLPRRVLVLAPHTDDAEFGMGGTLARLLGAGGTEIRIVAFSPCEESLPAGAAPGALRTEQYKAADVLGIAAGNVEVRDYRVRRFDVSRQEILEDLVALRREYAPDAVFLPAGTDVHQDHAVIHAEGVRAFKQMTVLGYELIWNNISFQSRCIVELSADDVEAKLRALHEYKSQSHRQYSDPEYIRSLARARGLQIGAAFGEAFDVVRGVWSRG